MTAPSIEAAIAMGATGGPVVEAERLAFEAWMQGHCWGLAAQWDGESYRSERETGSYLDLHAVLVRRMWAAWRDRAALVPNAALRGQASAACEGGGMSLPYDTARCDGVQYDGDWREGCEDCLRRTSAAGPMSPWIDAPLLVVFECECRIEPGDYK